jgi:translocation and assembly module TamB
MPRRTPRRFRIVWGLLGFLVVLAVCAASATQHPYVRERAHQLVSEAIRRELGLESEIGPVYFSLPLGITADYIRLTHPKHGLFASADKLEVQPSFGSLLRGRVDIDRILIEGAQVRLRVADGSIVNLPDFASRVADKKSADQRLPLEELVIRRAHLTVDAKPVFHASLSGLNAVVRVVDGTRVRMQLSVGEGSLRHEKGEERLSRIFAAASFAPGVVELSALRVDTSFANLSIDNAQLTLPFAHGRYRGKVKLGTDLGRLALLPHGLSLPPVTGRVGLDMHVEGTGSRYHARGSVHADNPTMDGFGFGILDLNVDVTPEELELLPGSQGKVPGDGGIVKMQGQMALTGSMPIEVKADVKALELHKLMAMLDVTQDCLVNWLLQGGFNIKGTLSPVDISGPIWADHLAFKALTSAWHDPAAEEVIGTPPGRVSGRVAIRPDALRFENLHGRLPHSDMMVTVHVGFTDQLSVTARSDHLDLRDATGLMGMPMTGVGAFSLDVGGTYDNTTLTGTLDLQDFSLDGYRLGHMRTSAVLEKDGVAVRFVDTRVEKNDSRYVIDDLFLDFSEAFSIDGSAHIDKLALADFYHTFAIENDPDFAPYQGQVRGSARARYTLGFPGDDADGTLRVDTELTVDELSAHGQKFERGRLEGAWIWKHIAQGTRGARLELTELALKKGQGSVHARGTMDYGGALAMTVFGEELMARDFELVREPGVDVNGEVNFVGTLRGSPWVPELALDVDLVGASFGDRSLDDARFVLRTSHREDPWVQAALTLPPNSEEPCIEARKALAVATWRGDAPPAGSPPLPPRGVMLCGSGFQKHVAFDMLLGVAPDLPARGQVVFKDLPMSWVVPRATRGAPPVRGGLTGRVDLSDGNLAAPDSLVGQVEVDRITLGQETTWLQSDGPVRVALTGQGARVVRARFMGHGSALEVTGGASFTSGLRTHVAGQFDMAMLSALVPTVVRSSGVMKLDVNVTGPTKDPSIYGRAQLSDGSLLVRGFNYPLEHVTGSVSFSEREVLLEALELTALGGKVRLHGSATVKGQALERYELFIDANAINYAPSEGIELAFSADTKLAWDKGARVPLLSGTVRLHRARYTRPFSLGITERLSGFSQAKRVYRDTYDPDKDNLAFDLRVLDDAPVRVANNLLNAELTIEDSEQPFRIVGTDQRMGVLGTLELARGTLTFRNSEFVIEEGTVDFIDEHRVRPRLDIHARTEFRRTADASGSRWWISLHASGEVDNLKLETSSEPALAQEDIALLLTVGLTRAEAERLGTGELTQGAALEALATVTGVDREVKKALPVIDDFAVTSAYSARSNRTEPQVVVGKRLGDKLRATATTGLTAESNFKTGVEWRFDDQTSIEAGYDNVQTTTSSQLGNVGVDLRWRLEFD